jgi:hypothetical protein
MRRRPRKETLDNGFPPRYLLRRHCACSSKDRATDF